MLRKKTFKDISFPKSMKKAFLFWILLYVYSFFIFYYSGNPDPGKGLGIQNVLNIYNFYVHLLEYFFFTILVYLAFMDTRQLQKNILFSTILFVTLFAISDELHQLFVPGRYFSIADIGIDVVGALLFFSGKTIYK